MTDTSRSRASKHSRRSLLKGFGTVAVTAAVNRSAMAQDACLGTATIIQRAPPLLLECRLTYIKLPQAELLRAKSDA